MRGLSRGTLEGRALESCRDRKPDETFFLFMETEHPDVSVEYNA